MDMAAILPESDSNVRDRLIVGLDVPDVETATALTARLGNVVTFYKIGYELGFAGGLGLAERLIGEGKKVFLDFKLHDIANTVERGVRSVARLGATYLTVHAYPPTLAAAAAGAEGTPLTILAVTVLTSFDDADAAASGYAMKVEDLVATRARQARAAGIGGIVCASSDAARVRAILGPTGIIVTPGVRPAGIAANDQKRVATPAAAIRAGADHLVVARPILAAADPRAMAERILDEIADACGSAD